MVERCKKRSSYFFPVPKVQLSRVRYGHRGVDDPRPLMQPSSWACPFGVTLKMLVLLLLLAPSQLLRLQQCLAVVVMKTWLRLCLEVWLVVFEVCVPLGMALVPGRMSCGFAFAFEMSFDVLVV